MGSGGGIDPATGRARNGRPITGTAVARSEFGGVSGGPIDLFGPWGRWYPWYGYGWNYGYVDFDPWHYYGGTRWIWGRYPGFWYDPYWGYSYAYDPLPAYQPGGYNTTTPPVRREVGSIRLKASPKHAKVYIDGALVGTVDEFDGLTNHLELETGTHRLELRADGYTTVSKDIIVAAEKTLTERLSMKKQ